FKPARLVALDHSVRSLEYARRVAADFDLQVIEYTYGDASQMIQRDKACRFKFHLNQGREITNSATDIRDDKTAAQAV
ncbi:hypothetical protein ACC846_39090, partial [Rhizobium ruizarguesonis]